MTASDKQRAFVEQLKARLDEIVDSPDMGNMQVHDAKDEQFADFAQATYNLEDGPATLLSVALGYLRSITIVVK